MANTLTNISVGGGSSWPTQQSSPVGSVVGADNWQRVLNFSNNSHAYGPCPRANQSYRGVLAYDANGVITYPWRVPLLSTAHDTVTVWLFCVTSGAGPKIRANSATAAASGDISPTVAWSWQSTDLVVTTGADFDDITLEIIDNAAGEEVEIREVHVEVKALASPLAAAAVGDFVPMGAVSNGADYALPASRLVDLAGSIDELYSRVRSVFCWAAPAAVCAAYKGTGGVSALEAGVRSAVFPFRSLDPDDAGGKVYWYATADTATDSDLSIRDLDGKTISRATVAAAGGTSWHADSLYLERDEPAELYVDRPLAPLWCRQQLDEAGDPVADVHAFAGWCP